MIIFVMYTQIQNKVKVKMRLNAKLSNIRLFYFYLNKYALK